MDYFIFTSCKAGKSELDNLNYDRRGEENIAMGVSRSKQEIDCVIASSIEVIHRKNSSKIYLKEGMFKLYKWNSDYSKLIITSTNHNNINAILEEII